MSSASSKATTFSTAAMTLSPEEKNVFANLSGRLSNDEKLQIDIALKNSLKDLQSMKKSVWTKDDVHIDTLRTNRRLFQASDKKRLQANTDAFVSSKKACTNPETILLDHTPPATANRLYNNGLDAHYFASIQQDNHPDRPAQPSVDSDWTQMIRHEVIRRMRTSDDPNEKNKAIELYCIFTPCSPPDKFTDIQYIVFDCKNAGMVISETVELMFLMI